MSDKKKKKLSASRLSALVENIKVEHDIPVLERIRYPIIWERTPNGYRIQDLQPSKIDNAIDIIKSYYIVEETLCKGINLYEDDNAVEEYLSSVASWLKDTQSLAAIEEGTGSVVGLLIGRVLDKTVRTQSRMTMLNTRNNTFETWLIKECPASACDGQEDRPATDSTRRSSRPKSKDTHETKGSDLKSIKSKSSAKISKQFRGASEIKEDNELGPLGKILSPIFDDELTIVLNDRLQAIHKLKSYLTSKIDILNLYGVDMYYSIYIILVIPDHRGKGVAKALIRSCIEMAKKVGCDVVSGIFSSSISQNIAYKEGFKIHEEMRLSDWTINGEEVFKEIDGNEHTITVMAHKMVLPEPPPPPPPITPPRRSTKSVRTR